MPLAVDGHSDNGQQGLYGDVKVIENGVWFSDGLDEVHVDAVLMYNGKKHRLSMTIPYDQVKLEVEGKEVSLTELSNEWYRDPETGQPLTR